MAEKQNILSCAQPTGDLHLGNYFGAVRNWVKLQEDYNCTYGVVDYHSMTMPYKPDKLRENTWKLAFQFMALGVYPENIFIQSLVPEHTELCWILGTVCSYGELSRMTQFKDKSDQIASTSKEDFVSAGLFYYPVLQAADILIYKADFVPVGKDQQQHLELSRNIANRFNNQFGVDYFKEPEYLFTETPKIVSLADPSKKMSKSLGDKHYVNIFGDIDQIQKQFKSAVTDSGEPGPEMSPGVANLFEIIKASGNTEVYNELLVMYEQGELQYRDLKESAFNEISYLIGPFQENYQAILADKKKYKSILKESSAEIRKTAQKTLHEVKEITGLLNVI